MLNCLVRERKKKEEERAGDNLQLNKNTFLWYYQKKNRQVYGFPQRNVRIFFSVRLIEFVFCI